MSAPAAALLIVVAFALCSIPVLRMKEATLAQRMRLLLLPATQMALIALLFAISLVHRQPPSAFVPYVVVCCVCVPLDVVLLRLLRRASGRDQVDERVRLLEEQRAALDERMASAQTELAKAADVYQDVAAQINESIARLDAGETADPRSSLEGATELIDSLVPRVCEHHVVGALVEMKARRANEAGVRLILELDVPEALPFTDTELCAVFSNVLDNALNACAAVDSGKRFIELRALRRGRFFVVDARNSYEPSVEAVGTRRERGKLTPHGWGLSIIESVAERHGGMLTTEARDGEFHTTVALALESAPATPAETVAGGSFTAAKCVHERCLTARDILAKIPFRVTK